VRFEYCNKHTQPQDACVPVACLSCASIRPYKFPDMVQNAIRKKNEALNYLRLGSRLDAVVSRLDTQVCQQLHCMTCFCNVAPAAVCPEHYPLTMAEQSSARCSTVTWGDRQT
jgi:hypothetical protein